MEIKYDYSRVNYISANKPVVIGCPEHGWVKQTPNIHLATSGCPECNRHGTVRNTAQFWLWIV